MILDYKKFKPIKTFGVILTAAGMFGISLLLSELNASTLNMPAIYFLLIMSIWHIVSGIGILLRKRWGFHLMKLYLYFMYLGIPIGTLLSKRIFAYINENDIELFFKGKEFHI